MLNKLIKRNFNNYINECFSINKTYFLSYYNLKYLCYHIKFYKLVFCMSNAMILSRQRKFLYSIRHFRRHLKSKIKQNSSVHDE